MYVSYELKDLHICNPIRTTYPWQTFTYLYMMQASTLSCKSYICRWITAYRLPNYLSFQLHYSISSRFLESKLSSFLTLRRSFVHALPFLHHPTQYKPARPAYNDAISPHTKLTPPYLIFEDRKWHRIRVSNVQLSLISSHRYITGCIIIRLSIHSARL